MPELLIPGAPVTFGNYISQQHSAKRVNRISKNQKSEKSSITVESNFRRFTNELPLKLTFFPGLLNESREALSLEAELSSDFCSFKSTLNHLSEEQLSIFKKL